MKKRKLPSGSELYTLIFQVVSLLPLPYMVLLTGSFSVLIRHGMTAVMFELFMACVPRIWLFIVSALYRVTINEILVYFLILSVPLALGLYVKKYLYEKDRMRILSKILIIFTLTDLLVRIVPLKYNQLFSFGYQVIGIIVCIISLIALLKDVFTDEEHPWHRFMRRS